MPPHDRQTGLEGCRGDQHVSLRPRVWHVEPGGSAGDCHVDRERSVDLVLAALEGDQAQNAAIDGSETPASPDQTAPRTTPTGAFLTQLVVRGFRGIGEEAILNLPPGSGLTVVAGRNGSGTSSSLPVLVNLKASMG